MVAVGTAVVIWAYDLAHRSTSSAHFIVFYVGFLLGLLAVFYRVANNRTANRPRASWYVVLSAFTFLPKFLMSLNGPVYYDEYNHYRHVLDILRTGNLSVTSSNGSIIQYYPGLHLATGAIHWVTQLPVWACAQVVLFLAHTATIFLIAALARSLGLTAAMTGLAVVVYCLNPSFVYFDTQFSYESIAVPLALLTTLCAVRGRLATSAKSALLWTIGGVLAGFACIVSHHISAFFMLGICALVMLFTPAQREGAARRPAIIAPVAIVVIVGGALAVWVTAIAKGTGGYLNPHLGSAFDQVTDLLTGRSGPKPTVVTGQNGTQIEVGGTQHTPFAGSTAPLFEKLCAYASPFIALVLIVLVVCRLWRLRRTDRHRFRLFLPFTTLSVAYLVSLPVGLTVAGGESAHRSWAFSYVGLALTAPLALPVLRDLFRRVGGVLTRKLVIPVLAGAAVAVLAIGNISAGENVAYRFPGPYQFGTDTRSRTQEGRDLAGWMNKNLPTGDGVISDRFTSQMINGYTDLRVVGRFQGSVFEIYRRGAEISPTTQAFIRDQRFKYFVLDKRIENQAPTQGFFAGYIAYFVSINPAALRNLSESPMFKVIHKTRNYTVYRLSLTG